MERRGMFFSGQSEHEFVFLLNTKLKKEPQKSTKSKGLAKDPNKKISWVPNFWQPLMAKDLHQCLNLIFIILSIYF